MGPAYLIRASDEADTALTRLMVEADFVGGALPTNDDFRYCHTFKKVLEESRQKKLTEAGEEEEKIDEDLL